MLVFSRVPEPSSLLWTDDKDLSPRVKTLLAQCKDVAVLEQPGAIDLLWHRAQSLTEPEDTAGSAVALLSLAEAFRTRNRLGPALRCVERAEDILGKWPHKKSKQNHAAALYACGMVYQMLGSYQEASNAYSKAMDMFKEAKAQWPAQRVTAEFGDRCIAAQRSIQELLAYVARAATCGDSGATQFCCLTAHWLAERSPIEDVQPAVSVALKPFTVDMALQCGHQSYDLRGLTGRKGLALKPQPDKEYRVVQVPAEIARDPTQARAPTVFKNAAYALVQGSHALDRGDAQARIYGIGAERPKADRLLWGEFVWDANTQKITFVARYQDRPLPAPKFVGEEDLVPSASGAIVGVFK